MKRWLLPLAVIALWIALLGSAGAQSVPGAPTIASVSSGDDSLTVAWSAPSDDGGSTITAYDLRYILSDAYDTSDANWTLLEDVWSSGALTYGLTGLSKDTSYSVQIRAVNSAGDGPWTDSTTEATTDHGDARTSATVLALDSPVAGRLGDRSDVDYFSITLAEETDLWVRTTGELDTALRLFDNNGRNLESDADVKIFDDGRAPDTGLRNASLHAILDAGTYYVEVRRFQEATSAKTVGPYSIAARVAASPGDSRDSAVTITPDTAVAARFESSTDVHYFGFEITESTLVMLSTSTGDGETLDTVARLSSPTGLLLAAEDDGEMPDNELAFVMIRGLFATNSFILRVSTFGGETGPYVLSFQTLPAVGSTTETAGEFLYQGMVGGQLASRTDKDYHRLRVHTPIWLSLEARSTNSAAPSLTLFDDAGDEVLLKPSSSGSTSPRYLLTGFVPPGTYYVRASARSDSRFQRYFITALVVDSAQRLLESCDFTGQRYQDPLFPCQWHLDGSEDASINLGASWSQTLGEGAVVGVFDSGVQITHPDLVDNVVTARNLQRSRPTELWHGTAVAGIIAARDNAIGVRGVAPRASIHSVDVFALDDAGRADAMVHKLDETIVANNSWGFQDSGRPQSPGEAWELAVERGVREGADGKGISYVWAAGNGADLGDDSNLDGRANHYAVTAVCATNEDGERAEYSETGANLWVCGPSNSDDTRGILTTEDGGYTTSFGGTSAAAPMVSGVIALVRSAYPDLTWRDVKLLLATTARFNDGSDTGWEQGARRYGAPGRYWFNHKYGFGIVDAANALSRAENWTPLPPLREITASSNDPLTIPDPLPGRPTTVSSSVVIEDNYVRFVEFVEINLNMDHDGFRDLEINLTSPSGAVSQLSRPGAGFHVLVFGFIVLITFDSSFEGDARMGSARHLGENPAGTWTLSITDRQEDDDGVLESWSMTVYGHGRSPGFAEIDTAQGGAGSLTVEWTAPTDSGDSTISGYDLRYIRSDATNRSSNRWTVKRGIWTSGDLSYELTGLTGGRSYDLQVRALNAAGSGPWSDPATGRPIAVRPDTPSISTINPRSRTLEVLWEVPFAGGASIDYYDVRYIRSDATDKTVDANWTVAARAGTRSGTQYRHRLSGLENGVSLDVQVRAHNRVGYSDWSATVTETPDAQNTNPSFPSGAGGVISVREDLAVASAVGSPVTATDADRDTLRYTLTGGGGSFAIDAATGQLTLLRALDYETTRSYDLTVGVSDDQDIDGDADTTIDDTVDVTVTVIDVNEGFTVSGPTSIDWAENQEGVVATYSAEDPEGLSLTWSTQDGDAALFVVTQDGKFRFRQPPDFETPGDLDEDNRYVTRISATDGVNTSRVSVAVTVENVEETPVLTGPAHVTVAENSGTFIARYEAEDPEGEKVHWGALSGPDMSKFQITRAGDLSFTDVPDFDAKADQDRDNRYEVTVRASDKPSGGLTGSRSVTVTVTDVDEPPAVTGPAAIEIEENGVGRLGVYRATDPEGGSVILTLVGDDREAFSFAGGVLEFRSAPDFEAKADDDGDNVYEVAVEARDSTHRVEYPVKVTVTNKDEAGSLTTPSQQPLAGRPLRATLSDLDGGLSDLSWQWERSQNNSSWVSISDATSASYTPREGDLGYYLRVRVTYRDGHGPQKRAAVALRRVQAPPNFNFSPAFDSSTAERSVPENAAPGTAVGEPLQATDQNNDTLGYTLSGSGSERFTSDDTGQIRVARGVGLNHEVRATYALTVTATDPSLASDTISLTITVTDVDEPPLAGDDVATTDEDTSVTVDVLSNDRDPEGDTLTVRTATAADPAQGTVTLESDSTVSYAPGLDSTGVHRFTYTVSDGTATDTATVFVTINPVNDAPVFALTEIAATVAELATGGTPVGAPVTAEDVDGDILTYSLSGGGDLFEIEPHTAQITVLTGAIFDLVNEPEHVLEVTAADPSGARATATVTVTVRAGPPAARSGFGGVSGGGGGGGGGGGDGPSPSTVDFEWTVKHDIEALDSGHDKPTGAWSDGATLWLLHNGDGADDAIYAYDRTTGERLQDREFALAERNRAPRGVWSDEEGVVWVSDSGRDLLFAYDHTTGERLEDRDIKLDERNADARGIWSDGETMWVLDERRNTVFAYDLESGALLAEYALDSANGSPTGIWSDGVTLWVSDPGSSPRRLFAYRLPTREEAIAAGEGASLERVRDEEFAELSGASNNSPRGIWSDGDFMYVADGSDGKVYTYNMPDAIDARLASLTLSGVDIGEFDPGKTDYEGVVAEGVTETVVTAEAMQRRTAVSIDPADADAESDGHQVTLAGLDEITVTVMSADRSRTRVYRVTFEPSVTELALGPAWTPFEWPGADDVAIAEADLPKEVVAVYTWDATTDRWLGYIPGLQDVPGLNTLTTFASGVTYWVAAAVPVTWTVPASASDEN